MLDDPRQTAHGRRAIGPTVLLTLLTVAVAGVALLLRRDPERAVFAELALLFASAALGWPRPVFRFLRTLGWFRFIKSDRKLRILLGFLAVGLAASVFG